jgi:ribose/xylose/arabinose/galactoside ABC-type transport system permease subunit
MPETPSHHPTSWRDLLRGNALAIVLLVLLAAAGIAAPSLFKADNLANMALQFAPLGVVVVGQMLVILVRGLDLSVSSVMATSAVVATSFTGQNADLMWIVPLALVMGAAVGGINGLLVTKRRVSPFLATLATMIVLQGARNAWTQGAPSGNVPPLLRTLGAGMTAGMPNNALALVLVATFTFVLLHRATFGRRVYLVGGGPEAARLVGIELDSIVAAVMGGIALSGGKGGVPGALMGAAILVVLSNAVVIVGLPIHVQLVMKGFIIVLAAALYVARSNGTR